MSTDRTDATPRFAAIILALSLFVVALAGCGYPKVSEPALRLAQAIDTVANLRDASQIPKGREIVEESYRSGEIGENERAMLLDILDRAEAGDWESAEANARSLLHAQNEHVGDSSL